jgi:hypothetical protein
MREEQSDAIDPIDDWHAHWHCPDGLVRVTDCWSDWRRAMANGGVCNRHLVVRDCARLGTAKSIEKAGGQTERRCTLMTAATPLACLRRAAQNHLHHHQKLLLLVLTGLLIATAHAAEPTGTVTLACQGLQNQWTSAGMKSVPITMTLIIDFQKRTIVGFPDSDVPASISNSDEMTITFSRDSERSRFNGIIDRKRNTTDAVYMSSDTNTLDFGYALKCRNLAG